MFTRIDKIKVSQDKTNIGYTKIEAEMNWDNYELSSSDKPKEEFLNSLQNLAGDVCIINEIDEKIAEKLKVTGVTFTHKNDNYYKVKIMAQRPVEISNAPVNISTPVLSLDTEEADNEFTAFKNGLRNKLDIIIEYAIKYINGDRDVMTEVSLFDEPEGD